MTESSSQSNTDLQHVATNDETHGRARIMLQLPVSIGVFACILMCITIVLVFYARSLAPTINGPQRKTVTTAAVMASPPGYVEPTLIQSQTAIPVSNPGVTSSANAISDIKHTITPVVVFSATSPATFDAGTAPVKPANSIPVTINTDAQDTASQLRIFDDLWQIVNDDYLYTNFNGLDWPEVQISTEKQIRAGMTFTQFYRLMDSVMTSLNDGHSYFLSPQQAKDEEKDYQGSGEYVGIGVITDINKQKQYAYVLQVLPNSPAQRAGIRAHDHIIAINEQPSVDAQGQTYIALLRGLVGTSVTVTVQTPGATPRDLVMLRENLPTQDPVEYRILTDTSRIGYILIPTFFEETMADQVRTALNALSKGGLLKGLIIDMRINNGGSYPVLLTSLGFFTGGTIGYMEDRHGVRLAVTPPTEHTGNLLKVPLVVLIGPATESYAEVFAGALQANGRASLVGQKSAGNIETLHGYDFEDGSEAWIAEETFHLPNGGNWEGKGLTPDIIVDRNWDDYPSNQDPVIATAVQVITGSR